MKRLDKAGFRSDVPPFCSELVKRFKTTDFMSEAGARQLCREIEKRWAAAGHPEIRAYPEPVYAALDKDSETLVRIWTIKIPGLLNGLPVETEEAACPVCKRPR